MPEMQEDVGSIPALGRSPGGGNDNPLQHSCLENPSDSGDWQVTVQGVKTDQHDWAHVGHNQFSPSVTSNSSQPHALQHTRLPVHHQLLKPAQTHVHWVSDAIQTSHPLFSPSSLAFNPSQGSFLVSQFFTSGGQSIGASASASVLPMNIQNRFPLGLTGLILAVQGTLKPSATP